MNQRDERSARLRRRIKPAVYQSTEFAGKRRKNGVSTGRTDVTVTTPIVEQRFAGMDASRLHAGDKDGVIAGEMAGDDLTLHLNKGVFEQRNVARGPVETNVQGLFIGVGLIGLRKKLRDGGLIGTKDVDAEAPSAIHDAQHLSAFGDADKNQRRMQGNGCKGICGHAMHREGAAFRGEDGDASSEMAQSAAKLEGGDGNRGHRGMATILQGGR